jgi:hypothetical protein
MMEEDKIGKDVGGILSWHVRGQRRATDFKRSIGRRISSIFQSGMSPVTQ